MLRLRRKSEALTDYFRYLLEPMQDRYRVITPDDPKQRGCQLSIESTGGGEQLFQAIRKSGAICDFRRPDVVRAAPVPLYNGFHDIWRFVRILREAPGNA